MLITRLSFCTNHKPKTKTQQTPNTNVNSDLAKLEVSSLSSLICFKKAVDSLYKENFIDCEVKDFLYGVIEGKDVNIDDISSYDDLAEEFDF